MANPASILVVHPENPSMGKDTSTPKETGQTRALPDGTLLYLEPVAKTEVPAVRLNDLRPQLVQEASNRLSYRFPKKRGFEDINVTAFVKKDYNFGPDRENRPDRLFQIESDGTKGTKPNGYVMYEDQVVLDAFDHGLRNFGTQLPMYVSSELEGHDIEDYLRRNREITLYDLIARAPNGYWTGDPEAENKKGEKVKTNKWHNGPPRVGTFSMRATRFRTDAGLLSWGTKEGTIPKNQRLLDLIPDQFKNPAVNSIKGWRDLNPAEVKAIKQGAKKTPQKARKKNRAAKAEKERQDQESTMNASVGGQRSLKDGQNISYGHEDAWLGAPYGQDGDSDDLEGPMSGPQIHRMITDHNSDWQVSSVRGEFAENVENQPFFSNSAHPRKWSRDSFNAASEKNISDLAQSRVNFPTQAQPSENEEAMPTFPKSRVSTKKLNHDGQSDSHESGPRIQFTQNDSIRSMNQRYDTPPSRVQKTKRTASKTVKKRKQTGNNTTTHSQRQRPKRRTEEHATKQTLAPNSQTTAESAPGVKDVIPATKYVIPSQNGQMNAQNPGFSWRATNVPNYFFQDLIGYVHQDDGQQEDIATGQVEQLPSINEQYEDPERVMSPIYWP